MDPVLLAKIQEQLGIWAGLAFNAWNLFSAIGIMLTLRFLSGMPWLGEQSLYRRFLPVLPETFGVGLSLLGAMPIFAAESITIQLLGGLWCGHLAKIIRKFIGQSLLGDDPKMIEAKRKKQ